MDILKVIEQKVCALMPWTEANYQEADRFNRELSYGLAGLLSFLRVATRREGLVRWADLSDDALAQEAYARNIDVDISDRNALLEALCCET